MGLFLDITPKVKNNRGGRRERGDSKEKCEWAWAESFGPEPRCQNRGLGGKGPELRRGIMQNFGVYMHINVSVWVIEFSEKS